MQNTIRDRGSPLGKFLHLGRKHDFQGGFPCLCIRVHVYVRIYVYIRVRRIYRRAFSLAGNRSRASSYRLIRLVDGCTR